MEFTKEQTEELQDLVDSFRKVPNSLMLIADGAFSHHGESDLSDALYLVAECVQEKINRIADLFSLS